MRMLEVIEERARAFDQAFGNVRKLVSEKDFDALPDALCVAQSRRRDVDQALNSLRKLAAHLAPGQERHGLRKVVQRIGEQVASITAPLDIAEAIALRFRLVKAELDGSEGNAWEEIADRLQRRNREFDEAADSVQAVVSAEAFDAVPAALTVARQRYEALIETFQDLRALIQERDDAQLLANLQRIEDNSRDTWKGLQTLVALAWPERR